MRTAAIALTASLMVAASPLARQAPYRTLNDKYTVFGRVIDGMDAVDTITPGEPPENPTKIVRASLGG